MDTRSPWQRLCGAWLLALATITLSACAAPSRSGHGSAAPERGCGGEGQPICEYAPARYTGRALCDPGSFFDPRNGGECWQCPAGTHRTIFPVTAGNACERPARTERTAVASRQPATGIFRTDCRKGHFLHQLSGWCYACPAGFNRTVFDINSRDACERVHPVQGLRADFKKKTGCASPSFFDPRKGGECWQCPGNWNRSIHPVNGAQACTAPIGTACRSGLQNRGGLCQRPPVCGGEQQRPCTLTVRIPSCNRGLVEDFGKNLCLPATDTVLQRLANEAVAEARPLLTIALEAIRCQSGPGRARLLERALHGRNAMDAALAITGGACFDALRKTAAQQGYQTLTVGVGAEAALGLAANTEVGVAIDMRDRRPARLYSTLGYAFGDNVGVQGALVVGISKSLNQDMAGDGHAISFGFRALGGASVGAGFDYQNRLQSVSVAGSGGLVVGGGVPVYSRNTTVLLK